ncbi:MAG: mercuric reductase [Candidatus Eisenbacteria bacterium]
MSRPYDAVIIGSGQGGGPLAQALATAGWRVALVERLHVGGTCVNEGCTPTKTMVASARVAYLARRAADYGVRTGDVSVDLKTVRERKRSIVTSFRDGSQRRLESTANLDLIFGEGSFASAGEIAVELPDGTTTRLEAKRVIVNTGGRPARIELPGIDQVRVLDSTSVMELGELPSHLVVLGGGYIGLEFGQMFRRFGSEVTIIQRSARLLGREDLDIADAVAEILRQDGIRVLLETEAESIAPRGDGFALRVRTREGSAEVVGSHLLGAIGRKPNVEALKLENAGIATSKDGHITVNDRLETNVPGIYAIGDVKGGPAFTHISYDDFRVLRRNLLEGGSASIGDRLVPYVVYIDPQLGRIGLSEEDARQRDLKVQVAKMPMSWVARALETDESRGFLKAIVDPETGLILGAAALGLEGGEIMSILQTAMMAGLPYTALRDAVWAHPSLAEGLNNLFANLEASPRPDPKR